MTDPIPRSDGRRRTRWLRRLAVAFASVGVALVGLELLLRLTGRHEPQPTWYVGEFENRPSDNFVVDARTGWRMRPGHRFTRPALGVEIEYLADGEGRRVAAAPREPRRPQTIALVGDSQTWGFGVPFEHTFGEVLAERLGGLRAVNLAQPGFGIDQVGLALRHQALPLEPALVVVGVFRNDFNRSLQSFRQVEGFNKPTFVLDGGELRERTADDRPPVPVVFLERHSHAWDFFADRLVRAGLRAPDTTWQDLNEALLARMQRDAEAAGVPIVFVRVPRALGTRFDALDGIASRLGLAYVDPATTPPDEADDLYLPDRHLTRSGHRWVADCLERWVRRELPELAPPGNDG